MSAVYKCFIFVLYIYTQDNISFTTEGQALWDLGQLHKYSLGSQVTHIPLTKKQSLKDEKLPTSLGVL